MKRIISRQDRKKTYFAITQYCNDFIKIITVIKIKENNEKKMQLRRKNSEKQVF